jgi:MFS family permease
LYIAAPIFGIGLGIYVPGSQTLALMRCPPDNRGYLSGIYTMGLDIGTLIGPVLFGVIIQFTNSSQDVFALAPVLMFIAAIVVLVPTRGYNK